MIQANGDLFKVCPFGLGLLYFIRLVFCEEIEYIIFMIFNCFYGSYILFV